MKAIKGFILFGLLGGLVSSCFEAPEFDDVPEISFQKIEFKETSNNLSDSLIIYIDFKDGDGDLGLDPSLPEDFEYPYNAAFYYLATGPGEIDSVTTIAVYNSEPPFDAYILLDPLSDIKGPLVTERMRNEPGFESLPPYNPNSCLDYSLTQVLVPGRLEAVDNTYNILDTLQDEFNDPYYLVEEALLYKSNNYHYNIEVEFLVLENGEYVPYDWFEKFCISFNGRFPLPPSLGTSERPLEGTIRYGMTNPTFLAVFSVKTLKLRVRIRDRALRTSNTVESRPFTLGSI